MLEALKNLKQVIMMSLTFEVGGTAQGQEPVNAESYGVPR